MQKYIDDTDVVNSYILSFARMKTDIIMHCEEQNIAFNTKL